MEASRKNKERRKNAVGALKVSAVSRSHKNTRSALVLPEAVQILWRNWTSKHPDLSASDSKDAPTSDILYSYRFIHRLLDAPSFRDQVLALRDLRNFVQKREAALPVEHTNNAQNDQDPYILVFNGLFTSIFDASCRPLVKFVSDVIEALPIHTTHIETRAMEQLSSLKTHMERLALDERVNQLFILRGMSRLRPFLAKQLASVLNLYASMLDEAEQKDTHGRFAVMRDLSITLLAFFNQTQKVVAHGYDMQPLCVHMARMLLLTEVDRDNLTHASMALSLVLKLNVPIDHMAHVVYLLLGDADESSELMQKNEEWSLLPILSWLRSLQLSTQLSLLAQQRFISALLSQHPAYLFTMNLVNGSSCFSDVFFPCIRKACLSTEGNVRLEGLTTLVDWLSAAAEILQSNKDQSDVKWQESLPNMFMQIESLVQLNWDHHFKSVISKSREVFRMYILCCNAYIISQQVVDTQADVVTSTLQEHWITFVKPFLTSSRHSRAHYYTIHGILPHVTTAAMNQCNADFMPMLMQAAVLQKSHTIVLTLLESFLLQARKEMVTATVSMSKKGKKKKQTSDVDAKTVQLHAEQVAMWRDTWMPHLVHVMCNGEHRSISLLLNLFVKKIDPDCTLPLLVAVKAQQGVSTMFISLLTSAKKTGHLDNDTINACLMDDTDNKELITSVSKFRDVLSMQTLAQGLTHADVMTRLSALEFVTYSARSTELFSLWELRLLRQTLPLLLVVDTSGAKSQLVHTMQSMMVRLRDSGQHWHIAATRKNTDVSVEMPEIVEWLIVFVKWFHDFLLKGLYPGASLERLQVALQLYRIFIELFSSPVDKNNSKTNSFWVCISEIMLDHSNVTILLHCMASSMEQIRTLAHVILLRLPTPRLSTRDELERVLQWSCDLAQSPRVRDTDAAALLSRLVFQKAAGTEFAPALRYFPYRGEIVHTEQSIGGILSFLQQFEQLLQEYIVFLSETYILSWFEHAQGRINGHLVLFSHVVKDYDWSRPFASVAVEQELIQSIVTLLVRVLQKTMTLYDEDESATSSSNTTNPQQDDNAAVLSIDCRGHATLAKDAANATTAKSQAFLLSVNSWLVIKEAMFALSVLVKHDHMLAGTQPNSTGDTRGCRISIDNINLIGHEFIRVLSSSKHNGVIEKAYQAFLLLCETVLRSPLDDVTLLATTWTHEFVSTVKARDEKKAWIRRSAGLPYCFLSVLEAEPASSKKPLLVYVLRELLQVVDVGEQFSWESRVHGLNILRAIFRDATLALDVMTYVPRAITSALAGFSHAEWGVRNASLMIFVAIIQRAVRKSHSVPSQSLHGAVNRTGCVHRQWRASALNDTQRSGMTFDEFFSVFPSLREFLLTELSAASVQSGQLSATLYPMLLLLSHLSPPSGRKGSQDNAKLFLPSIYQCAQHSHFMVRQMAANVLISLVPQNQSLAHIKFLLEMQPLPLQSNHAHGHLLQIHGLLRQMELVTVTDMKLLLEVSSLVMMYFADGPGGAAPSVQELGIQCIVLTHDLLAIAYHNEDLKENVSRIANACVSLHKLAVDTVIRILSVQLPSHYPGAASLRRVAFDLLTAIALVTPLPLKYERKLQPALVLRRVLDANIANDIILCSILAHVLNTYENDDKIPSHLAWLRDWLFASKLLVPDSSAECLVLLLKLLHKLLLIPDFAFTSDQATIWLSQITKIVAHSTIDAEVKASAVIVIGLLSNSASNGGSILCDILDLCTAESQPLHLRMASLSALEFSSFDGLKPHELPVTVWRMLIALVQDRDGGIRIRASALALNYLYKYNDNACDCFVLELLFRALGDAIVALVSKQSKQALPLWQLLNSYSADVCDKLHDTLSLQKDLQVELFAKEKANSFKETVLLIEISVLAIQRILVKLKTFPSFQLLLSQTRILALQECTTGLTRLQLETHSTEHKSSATTHFLNVSRWYGGATYMFDVFQSMYALLLRASIWLSDVESEAQTALLKICDAFNTEHTHDTRFLEPPLTSAVLSSEIISDQDIILLHPVLMQLMKTMKGPTSVLHSGFLSASSQTRKGYFLAPSLPTIF